MHYKSQLNYFIWVAIFIDAKLILVHVCPRKFKDSNLCSVSSSGNILLPGLWR